MSETTNGADLLDGTGHPRHFGYVKCSRCGTMRPRAALIGLGPDAREGYACSDVTWCLKQVNGKPTGLDANGDAA